MDYLKIKGLTKSDKLILHNASQNILNNKKRHEQLFLEIFSKNYSNNFIDCLKLTSYIYYKYPEYLYTWLDFMDVQKMQQMESNMNLFILIKNFEYKNPGEHKFDEEKLKKAINYGEIVTNFCIQCLGYSLIGTSGAKSVLTSENNCEKEFEEYLKEGYNLFRMPKIYFKYDEYEGLYFPYELPVLPIYDNYYDADEYILNNNEYIKVLK